MIFSSNQHNGEDTLTRRLESIAQNILVVVFGLLPIFFIPTNAAPLLYTKTALVVGGIALALLVYGFVVLRRGSVRFAPSPLLAALWGVGLVGLLSAFLSRDIQDALVGSAFEVHTAFFVVLLAVSATAWMLLHTDKGAIIRLYVLLSVSTIILSIFHIARLALGAETLSLGVFPGATDTPLGSWNDLALFFGLAVILSLVALGRLPSMTRAGQALFAFVVLVSMVMLAVINFSAVWLVLGFVGLLILVHNLSRPHFTNQNIFAGQGHNQAGMFPTLVATAVFAVSCVFIVGGGTLENAVSGITNISYTEVRPSFTATTGIAEAVYQDRAFFGIGPNKFVDAWHFHKDPAINSSIFWNVDFASGVGYIPTFFVTTGVVGGVAWLIFLGLFIFTGVRMLLKASASNHVWHFIGVSSFVTGLYLWGTSFFYVPGPAILLLAAMCTGLLATSYAVLVRGGVKEYQIGQNRTVGFMVLTAVVILVLGAIATLYFAGRHYTAVYTFNQSTLALQNGVSIDEAEQRAQQAFTLFADDRFLRRIAEYQIARMNSLLQSEATPTDDDRLAFQNAFARGVAAAEQAIALDGTSVANRVVLGNLYSALIPSGVEGAFDRAQGAYQSARELDPQNPSHFLRMAQAAYSSGDEERARLLIVDALGLKQNYSQAIFFLSQIEIANGNIDNAAAVTRRVVALEPQNPVRYYQLGVLEYAREEYQNAGAAFARAIALNPTYANARYFLALVLDQLGRSEEARQQLEVILELNPGNETVLGMIERIDAGTPLVDPTAGDGEPIANGEGVEQDGSAVTTTTEPDTSLVAPLNTSASEENNASGE